MALTDNLNTPVVVQLADVPGAEPAPALVVDELLLRLLGVLVVALRHAVAADHYLSLEM